MVASSFLETMFSFVHHYDRDLVLNKDENTHLEECSERRRGRGRGEWEGGVGRRGEGEGGEKKVERKE